MDFPIHIIWMSPLLFLGALGVIFHLISFLDEILKSKQRIALGGMPGFAASHLRDMS